MVNFLKTDKHRHLMNYYKDRVIDIESEDEESEKIDANSDNE